MGGGSTGGSGGSGTGSSYSYPTLYNWSQTTTPWALSGQASFLPYLFSRATSTSGMTPEEESSLWGASKQSVEESAASSGSSLAKSLASSGISSTSPAAAGGYSDIASSKIKDIAKAANDFTKLKMGSKDTAISQLLTALYTPSTATTGTTSTSTQNQSTSSGK